MHRDAREFAVTGLEPGTAYTIYMITDHEGDVQSDPSRSLPFTTDRPAVTRVWCSFRSQVKGDGEGGCERNHLHHLSFNRGGRWGTTDDFATSFLQFPLFSTAFWDLPNSRPVHSLMLSSHLFLRLPPLLPPLTVPCKMVLARLDERET